MFGRVFYMDCKRSFRISKILPIIVLTVFLMLLSSKDQIAAIWNPNQIVSNGSISLIITYFLFLDKYKVIVALLLGSLYTSSFCSDDNTHYLRMILSRTDITTYTQSRFLANTLVIVFACTAAFYLFCLILAPKFPLIFEYDPIDQEYYADILSQFPLIYIGMAGLQFGIIVAACSSIGLLLSAYDANTLVSIELTGICLFAALSYTPKGTPFCISNLSYLWYPCELFLNFPRGVTYAWGILYPTLVICLCGYLFYRRLERRVFNGFI